MPKLAKSLLVWGDFKAPMQNFVSDVSGGFSGGRLNLFHTETGHGEMGIWLSSSIGQSLLSCTAKHRPKLGTEFEDVLTVTTLFGFTLQLADWPKIDACQLFSIILQVFSLVMKNYSCDTGIYTYMYIHLCMYTKVTTCKEFRLWCVHHLVC